MDDFSGSTVRNNLDTLYTIPSHIDNCHESKVTHVNYHFPLIGIVINYRFAWKIKHSYLSQIKASLVDNNPLMTSLGKPNSGSKINVSLSVPSNNGT